MFLDTSPRSASCPTRNNATRSSNFPLDDHRASGCEGHSTPSRRPRPHSASTKRHSESNSAGCSSNGPRSFNASCTRFLSPSNLMPKRSNARGNKLSSRKTGGHFSSQSHAQATVRSNVLLETPAFSRATQCSGWNNMSATESATRRLPSATRPAMQSPPPCRERQH